MQTTIRQQAADYIKTAKTESTPVYQGDSISNYKVAFNRKWYLEIIIEMETI